MSRQKSRVCLAAKFASGRRFSNPLPPAGRGEREGCGGPLRQFAVLLASPSPALSRAGAPPSPP
jgi:hypothetical protein